MTWFSTLFPLYWVAPFGTIVFDSSNKPTALCQPPIFILQTSFSISQNLILANTSLSVMCLFMSINVKRKLPKLHSKIAILVILSILLYKIAALIATHCWASNYSSNIFFDEKLSQKSDKAVHTFRVAFSGFETIFLQVFVDKLSPIMHRDGCHLRS